MWYSTSQCLIFTLVCSAYATEMAKPNKAVRQEMEMSPTMPMSEGMGTPMPEMPMPEMAMPEMAMPAKEPSTANGEKPAAAEAAMPGMPMAEAGGLKPAAIVMSNEVAGMALATGGAGMNSANATARASAASVSEPRGMTSIVEKTTAAGGAAPKSTGAVGPSRGNTTEKASAPGAAGATGGAVAAGQGAGTRTLAAIARTTVSGVINTYYTAPLTTATPEAAAPQVQKGAALTLPAIVKAGASGGVNGTGMMNPNSAERGSTTGNLVFSGAITFAIAMYLL